MELRKQQTSTEATANREAKYAELEKADLEDAMSAHVVALARSEGTTEEKANTGAEVIAA
jgi:hypothetical protein